MVSIMDGLVVIGGKNDTQHYQSAIYLLNCSDFISNDCFWYKMNKELSLARADFVAFSISDSLTECEE